MAGRFIHAPGCASMGKMRANQTPAKCDCRKAQLARLRIKATKADSGALDLSSDRAYSVLGNGNYMRRFVRSPGG